MQVVRSQTQTSILIIEDDFATIEKVREQVISDVESVTTVSATGRRTRPAGLNVSTRIRRPSGLNQTYKRKKFYDLKLKYSIGIDDVFKNKAYSVRVQIATKFVNPISVITPQVKARGLRSIIANIQNYMLVTKALEAEQAKYLLTQTVSDVTVYIDNSIVDQLRHNVPIEDIQQAYKKKLVVLDKQEFVKKGIAPPQLSSENSSTSKARKDLVSDHVKRSMMFNMLSNFGIDPSEVSKIKAQTVNSTESAFGIVVTNEKQNNNASNLIMSRLVSSLLQDSDGVKVDVKSFDDMKNSDGMVVFTSVLKDTLTIPVYLTVDKDNLYLEQQPIDVVHVKFELLNESGQILDAQLRSIDVSNLEKIYNIPRKSPVVNVSSSGSDVDLLLQAKQADPVAKGMKVYKKTIHNSLTQIDDYELVGDFNTLNPDDVVSITTLKPINSMVLYRFIAYGDGARLSSVYTNVILRPRVVFPIKSASVYAEQESTGIRINVLQLPPEAVSVAVVVKNLSRHERTYKIVSDVRVIDDQVKAANLISFFDQNVKENNSYSYAARFYFKSGLHVDVGNDVITFYRPEVNKVAVTFTNVVIDQLKTNVSFDIEALLENTTTDDLLELMRAGDFIEFYSDEMKNERESMKMLIAYNIQRVDTTTGDRVNFGVLTTPKFDDAQLSSKLNIPPLVQSHQYVYYVYPLLRSAESTLERFVKQSVDQHTQKTYTYSPNKFRHPINISSGLLTDSAGRNLLFALSELQYGIIGDVKSFNVTFDRASSVIFDQIVKRLDADNVIIQWKIAGDLSQIDHFILLREVNGVRSLVGHSHCEFINNNVYYVHELNEQDVGDVQYTIIMVMNDYSIGNRVQTNRIRVNA